MEGKIILVVGGRGMGKTTTVRNMVKKVHPEALLLYDPAAQYTDLYDKPLLDFEDFKKETGRVKRAFIVFEEATIFLGHYADDDIKNMLVRSRYDQNTAVFVFHSLRLVPRYIYDMADYLILLKTNDSPTFVQSRFEDERLTKVFIDLQKMPMNTNETGRGFSPQLVHKIN